MCANWNNPALADPYPNFQDSLKERDTDSATLFLVDPTNPPVGVIRYNRSLNLFQEWNGSTWVNKVIAAAGGGTGQATALNLGTMAPQNANNVNITGGNITSLSSLGSNGTITGGLDITAARNIGVSNDIYVTRNVSAAGLSATGDVTAGRLVTNGAGGHAYIRGILVTGNADLLLTNAAGKINNLTSTYFATLQGHEITNLNGSAIDRGSIWVGFIGSGATGAGTKVLLDNGVWTDKNLVGGGMVEVVHGDVSMGTGEATKTFFIGWAGAMPANKNKVSLQFNHTGDGLSFVIQGPNQVYLSRIPASQPALFYYTAFHHITQV
jgi:hypothetical protein